MWTDDCQGKKDYDGRLVSISCRYWPGPAGMEAFNTVSHHGGDVSFSNTPYGKRPSANASIILNFGTPLGPDDFDDYSKWREKDFEADSEAVVKMLVENWVKEQMADLAMLLGFPIESEYYAEAAPEGRTLRECIPAMRKGEIAQCGSLGARFILEETDEPGDDVL